VRTTLPRTMPRRPKRRINRSLGSASNPVYGVVTGLAVAASGQIKRTCRAENGRANKVHGFDPWPPRERHALMIFKAEGVVEDLQADIQSRRCSLP